MQLYHSLYILNNIIYEHKLSKCQKYSKSSELNCSPHKSFLYLNCVYWNFCIIHTLKYFIKIWLGFIIMLELILFHHMNVLLIKPFIQWMGDEVWRCMIFNEYLYIITHYITYLIHPLWFASFCTTSLDFVYVFRYKWNIPPPTDLADAMSLFAYEGSMSDSQSVELLKNHLNFQLTVNYSVQTHQNHYQSCRLYINWGNMEHIIFFLLTRFMTIIEITCLESC